jgi:hypothetical protein
MNTEPSSGGGERVSCMTGHMLAQPLPARRAGRLIAAVGAAANGDT